MDVFWALLPVEQDMRTVLGNAFGTKYTLDNLIEIEHREMLHILERADVAIALRQRTVELIYGSAYMALNIQRNQSFHSQATSSPEFQFAAAAQTWNTDITMLRNLSLAMEGADQNDARSMIPRHMFQASQANAPASLSLPDHFAMTARRKDALRKVASMLNALVIDRARLQGSNAFHLVLGPRGVGKTVFALAAQQAALVHYGLNRLIPVYYSFSSSVKILPSFAIYAALYKAGHQNFDREKLSVRRINNVLAYAHSRGVRICIFVDEVQDIAAHDDEGFVEAASEQLLHMQNPSPAVIFTVASGSAFIPGLFRKSLDTEDRVQGGLSNYSAFRKLRWTDITILPLRPITNEREYKRIISEMVNPQSAAYISSEWSIVTPQTPWSPMEGVAGEEPQGTATTQPVQETEDPNERIVSPELIEYLYLKSGGHLRESDRALAECTADMRPNSRYIPAPRSSARRSTLRAELMELQRIEQSDRKLYQVYQALFHRIVSQIERRDGSYNLFDLPPLEFPQVEKEVPGAPLLCYGDRGLLNVDLYYGAMTGSTVSAVSFPRPIIFAAMVTLFRVKPLTLTVGGQKCRPP
ncbi:hypothetical protein DFJ77DRAFT_478482 [Powellomyces hirtus]|nr:hypothetical protein DFJ77DRAFT_478482 [Powellomyces hirtus]